MKIHAFTSITANYLPKARVLARSLKTHEPEVIFHLLLSDALPEGWDLASEPFDSVIGVEQLPILNRESWIFMHSVVELCTAVKGVALQELFRHQGADAVLYFDPDIVLFSNLDRLRNELERHSILVTPHQTEPESSHESIVDNEICSLRHGVFNLGFLGVSGTGEGRRFADWWAERLLGFCYDNIPEGLFTDQRWMDLAPAFFDDLRVLRGPEYNVATWNITHREASGSLAEGVKINGRPLCFYHFSGFDSGAQKAMLDKYGANNPVLYELRKWYIERCNEEGQGELGKLPCVYDFFDNGERITREHRVLYRSRLDLQRAFPEPRNSKDINRSYYHWYAQEIGNAAQYVADIDSVEGLRAELGALRQELDIIKGSRSWRLARVLASAFRPLRRR